MRPRFFISLTVLAEVLMTSLMLQAEPTAFDPIFSLLSELPVVGLMIWLVLKLDERHRDSIKENRQFYRDLLLEVMEFTRETRRDEKG